MTTREVRLRNDVAELGRISAEVAVFAAAHGVRKKDYFEVTLALDEILTNIIWYGFDDEAEHEIVVRLALGGGELTLVVEDDGLAFDPLALPAKEEELERDIEARPIGGLGIHLVRRTMDALVYRREMGKNVLTMTKRLGARE